MARSRGASIAFESRLDRGGMFISPAAIFLQKAKSLSGHVTLQGPGAEPVPEPLPTVSYRSSPASWSRNMDAYELACMIDMAFRHPEKVGDGLIITLTEEEYQKLNGDMRRHFVPVRREIPSVVTTEAPPGPESVPIEDVLQEAFLERDELRRKLEVKGVRFDLRWGIPRLRAEVEAQESKV